MNRIAALPRRVKIALLIAFAFFGLPRLMQALFFFSLEGFAALVAGLAKLAVCAGFVLAALWIARSAARGTLAQDLRLDGFRRRAAPALAIGAASARALAGLGAPRALLWFMFTAALVAVETITPVVGLLLIFVGAPFWPIVTVNAGFAMLIVEPFRGRVSKVWSAVGALWFAGYFALAAYGHAVAARLAAEAEVENARQSLAFDPQAQALLIQDDGAPDPIGAVSLLQSYDLPVVYVETARNRSPNTMAWRMGLPEICARLTADKALVNHGASAMVLPVGGEARCFYSLPEAPALPTVTIRESAEDIGRLGVSGRYYRFDIVDGGAHRRLTTGQVNALA